MNKEKEKLPVGRPTVVLDNDQIKQVEYLSSVLSIKQISDFFGFDADTFTAIKKRQPEVESAYLSGKAKAVASAGQALLTQANNGVIPALIFYLKTQGGWKEGDSTTVNVNIAPKNFNEFYDDEGDDE